ncbi:DC-STAMP domain-containing protein 2 isoform X1 [Nothobranchius furzeri]|uniref:DC-STAMP domain containing 2 n=4 Tax=Nothobranchius TaxID=28779 RepID=A0A8C6LP91_NOTFU|nr:transcript variant X1 [Nothobranchius furzeri]KAF7226477.1 transcript variant X2 [Nothobranchius furzeri]
MGGEEERRKLLKSDVTIQVVRGGATQKVTGVLLRSGGRPHLRRGRELRAHLVQAGRSLMAFFVGLLLVSLYGAMTLFLQNQPLWFCVYSTVALAGLVAFGMGLSAGVRTDVMVMLPSMCSARGRNLLLLLFVSVLISGPVKNTMENMERAASSLVCGAELAANQTQELMQRAATPFLSVIDKVRKISSNAYAIKGRVQNFISALTESIRHVARTLRNVLHFLVDIGDICNDKLGTPYRKCRAVFAEARSDCNNLLGEFNFLCDIVDGFLPLCNIARAGEFFCIIPSYVAAHLKQRLADPTVAAFKKMMQEFDFNITSSVRYNMDANSSSSLQQVSQEIMAEISSDLQMFEKLRNPLMYGGLVLLGLSFLRAVQYRRRYLRKLSFDNFYIDSQFKDLDQHMTLEGGASVLPLTRREARTYITPLSFQLSHKERRAVLVGVVSVFKHLMIGCLLVALDFLVFWILDQVYHQVKGDVFTRAPVSVAIRVNGSGYASDIFRDLVASFNILQGGNITVISRKCLMELSEPSYTSCFLLGFLSGLALLLSLTGGYMQRCRRLICAWYHPERERERIRFLHQQILNQRRAVGRVLRMSALRNQADREEAGAAGCLQTLLTRLPGGRVLLPHLQVLLSPVTCLTCGDVLRSKDEDTITCDVPKCSGVYCRPCFHNLGNKCVICIRPLTFEEDCEEELDSSDDEQLNLWSAAPKSPDMTDSCSRILMRRRISTPTHRRPVDHSARGVRTDGNDGGQTDSSTDSELSEADVTFQEQLEPNDSNTYLSTFTSEDFHIQDETLVSVCVHTPDHPSDLHNLPEPSPKR